MTDTAVDAGGRGAMPDTPGEPARAGNLVGDRLRDIRRQQGLSLAEVEERSGGAWKAVVVGAYERGDRAVTVPRLAELADFYGVPLSTLLPTPAPAARRGPNPSSGDAGSRRPDADGGATGDGGSGSTVGGTDGVRLDLRRLADPADGALDPIALQAIARFADHIQRQRGDHNGRVLTVRADDLRTIAVAIGHDPETLVQALRNLGAAVTA